MSCPYKDNLCRIRDINPRTCKSNYENCIAYLDMTDRLQQFVEANREDGVLEFLLQPQEFDLA